jgi:hypothetical protein
MSTGAFLNKNKKFEDVDFEKVQRDIKKIKSMEGQTKVMHN